MLHIIRVRFIPVWGWYPLGLASQVTSPLHFFFQISMFISVKEKYKLYSKTCVKRPLKIHKTKILMTNGSLIKVESIAECSPWSILQYFWPTLSDNWSWKPIFRLFESGRFTQVLQYKINHTQPYKHLCAYIFPKFYTLFWKQCTSRSGGFRCSRWSTLFIQTKNPY